MGKLYAFDAAYSPDLAKVKAAGGIAINGYLTGTYANSTTQPAAAHKAGLGYVPTYERAPAELVGASRATGRAVGSAILAAFKAKGIPLDGTIAVYPSVDVSVAIDGTDHDADACNTAWQGIRDVLAGKVSIRAYAEGAVIDALASAGLVDGPCWLAAPTSWPGFNVNDKHVCMVQLVGSPVSSTDANHIITDPHSLGAWWPTGSPYAAGATVADPDPMEVIVSMSGAPSTYKEFLADVQALVDNPKWEAHGRPSRYAPTTVMRAAADDLNAPLAKILADVAPRVASLQQSVAAVAKTATAISKAVAAITPAAEVALDVAAIAEAVVGRAGEIGDVVLGKFAALFKAGA